MEPKKERRQYTKAERKQYLERFAKDEGIKYPTFSYWIKTSPQGSASVVRRHL